MKDKILSLLGEIHAALANPKPDTTLPQDTHLLACGDILCLPREYGDSRFPYDADGLMVWAHTSGYIDACESLFTLFRAADYNEDTPVVFFVGEKRADGGFDAVSINGAARQLYESEDVKRYIVFSLRCAYYIIENDGAVYALRVHIDDEKRLHFTSFAANTGSGERSIYLSSYFEAMLRYIEAESFFMKMTKYAERLPDGSCVLTSLNACFDCLSVTRTVTGTPSAVHETVGKRGVLGGKGRCLTNAVAWKLGDFTEHKTKVNTTDLPVAADIMHFTLAPGADVRIDYMLTVSHDTDTARSLCAVKPDPAAVDAALAAMTARESASYDKLRISFGGWQDGRISASVLNKFISCVQKQVSFCALGKNYAGPHLGIRDVFQQLESALMWEPGRSREQMKRVFDFILSDGRAPRQISFPPDAQTMPNLDLRPYIDQGLWIISTVYTYLCWTGDFSLLDEECGYYDCAATYGPLSRCAVRDSILCHLLRICDFLCSNIDETTGCLHALYGDWNDALDGLGRTRREGHEFGDGVTVMATLQFYANTDELTKILTALGGHEDYIAKLARVRRGIEEGLIKYAVDEKNGMKRIIHGWGDMRSYRVGSFCDYDGQERLSLTANSFWSISGMLERTPGLRDTFVSALDALDSKYGLLTFDKYFARGGWQVGRISTITPGTYENSCCYVHAGMFGVMALFAAGEAERAWKQLEKSMVITHENATMTTFVMPNSYCRAPEYDIDGDSMGDWYTGSGTVLIKALVRYGFGVVPALDGLRVQTPRVMPADSAEIAFTVRGRKVTLTYKNAGEGTRRILLDGSELETTDDPAMGVPCTLIPYEKLTDGAVIEVRD